jgi:hypothetical protein
MLIGPAIAWGNASKVVLLLFSDPRGSSHRSSMRLPYTNGRKPRTTPHDLAHLPPSLTASLTNEWLSIYVLSVTADFTATLRSLDDINRSSG